MSDVNRYLEMPYSRVLKTDEDGSILGSVVELPGCFAEGDTETEALENLRAAMTVWLQQAIDAGLSIPPPSIDGDLPSGKILARLPKSIHKKLIDLATSDGISLNSVLVIATTDYVARREEREDMRQMVEMVRWNNHQSGGWNGQPRRAGTAYLEKLRRVRKVGPDEPKPHQHRTRLKRA